jgi:elongation factor P
MDAKTYEQVEVGAQLLGKGADFLTEHMALEGQWHEGEWIAIAPPIFVDLQVTSTEPGVRGDTSKASMKPATLETGATVQVPLFVEIGDRVRVDTRTGAYVSRV